MTQRGRRTLAASVMLDTQWPRGRAPVRNVWARPLGLPSPLLCPMPVSPSSVKGRPWSFMVMPGVPCLQTHHSDPFLCLHLHALCVSVNLSLLIRPQSLYTHEKKQKINSNRGAHHCSKLSKSPELEHLRNCHGRESPPTRPRDTRLDFWMGPWSRGHCKT